MLTKMDLADAIEFDLAAADGNIQRVRPGKCSLMSILRTASMTRWGSQHETAAFQAKRVVSR